MRIVVTRSEAQADELVRRLELLGHDVVRCPLIRIEPLGDDPIDPSPYDWVVVTSPNGALALARRLSAKPRHLAAIGPGTAETLRENGLEPDLVPRVSTQEGLRAELPAGRVLLAAAEGARRVIDADFLPLYRTIELMPEKPPEGDVALLASPSAARAFAATGARMPVVAIGPQTAAEAHVQGLDLVAVAKTHDLDGLIEAVTSLEWRPEHH
jgi:uroporphyrinogen III methyltransferase/synthase